jgi:CBS domain-containing protein
MPFLSELLNRTVYDSRGEAVGKCVEVYVNAGQGFPSMVALGLQREGQEHMIAAPDPITVERKGVILPTRLRDLNLFEAQGDEIALARQVLDRQIIDINGKRVVRVYDLQFAYANGKYRLMAVDATPSGLARRVGLEGPIKRVLKTFAGRPPVRSIPWDRIDPTAIGPAGIPLKVAKQELGQMHPADIADIVEQLDREAMDYVFSTLDTELAADTMEEIEPEYQASALESLEPERAADILEAMQPDEAADVLGDMPEDMAADLLNRMDQEEAEDVRELLAYPEESAGGIMTTEYIAIDTEMTAEEVIERMRALSPNTESIYYLYVVDSQERLLGVISLRDLLIAKANQQVASFMANTVISVRANDSEEEVAAVLAKYNLLAVPVVNAEGKMLGIVTVDDAIDSVIPGALKRRLPKVF